MPPAGTADTEGAMQARDYQRACVDAIIDAMADGHKGILCDLFTGAGKTVIFSMLARECFNSKVLILGHQRELVWQAADKVDAIVGEDAQVEMAQWWAQDGRVTVACTPTIMRGRHRRFLGHRIVIVDEAHRQMSEAMLNILREFQEHGAHVIGFTATPFRMDGKRLMDFYDNHAFSMGPQAGIQQGWCVYPRAKIVKCDYLDLKRVRVVGKEYSAQDLDMILGCSRALHQMCLTVQKYRKGPALAFLPGVNTAVELAKLASREYGIKAEFICGDTNIQPEDERNRIMNLFRAGEIELLCNCMVAAEGFDAPVAQTVFMFRPTRSRPLALQIWGRVMRALPGTVDGLETAEERHAAIEASAKDHCRIIDITDSLNDHSIVTAVDMFARDDTPDDVRREARERAADEDAEPEGPEDLIAQAAEKLRKAKLLEEGLALLHGRADGRLHDQEVTVAGKKKCISEYKVPIRGRFAGKTMGELDDGFIQWALSTPSIKGWQRSYFAREQARRRAIARHVG
jgi:superfamily II DNA or RNA helicase